MKFLLVLTICSSVIGECMPPFTWHEPFRTHYDCAQFGYEEAAKKLKEIGAKIEKELRKQDKEKPLRDLMMGGTKYGSFKSGGAVCKLAKRGKGRAYGKNS